MTRWLLAVSVLSGCTTRTPAPPDPVAMEESVPGKTAEEVEAVAESVAPTERPVAAASSPQPPPGPEIKPLPYQRPLPSDADVRAFGITAYRSQSLRLLTDADGEDARQLPDFADAAAVAIAKAFGPVPAAVRPQTDPPWTGLAIQAEERFRDAGLLSDALPGRLHGRHAGWRFWMRWPATVYFRRHLMVHEMTHCWTMAAGGRADAAFLEGVAEWLATHRVDGGAAAFGVVPLSPQESRSWGRIELFRDAHAESPLSAGQVMSIPSETFAGRPVSYARAWAVVVLMDRCPQTQEEFRRIVRRLTSGEQVRGEVAALAALMDEGGLWSWWADVLDYGVDPKICSPAGSEAEASVLAADARTVTVAARAGWQSTGVRAPDVAAKIVAAGDVTLGRGGRPWVSRPEGIRLDYCRGVPVGTLMAVFRDGSEWGEPIVVGRGGVVRGRGELYLRVNDNWSQIGDNSGAYEVTLSPAE